MNIGDIVYPEHSGESFEVVNIEDGEATLIDGKGKTIYMKDVTEKSQIFILDSEEAFTLAERFKQRLENGGYRVTTNPWGFNGVRITGTR